MKKYLQLHILTSYPPSNLNRDDLGRPKTAVVGDSNRLRISSQSLKRAWRTSEVFQQKLGAIEIGGRLGIRTKRIGRDIYKKLKEGGIKEKEALEWTRSMARVFGKNKDTKKIDEEIGKTEALKGISDLEKKHKIEELEKSKLDTEQLAFISPEEQKSIFELCDSLCKNKKEPEMKQLGLLSKNNSAADVALFGRMLANHPSYNKEAAVQVAHAFTVQKIEIEEDFFTAVDDLNRGEEELGAGHMGETQFASGIFYVYINLDRGLLLDNLQADGTDSQKLMQQTIQALIEAVATVAPTGKQNSFASRARAHYIMAELGNQQPRTLALAFVQPIEGNLLESSVSELEEVHKKMDQAYGSCSDAIYTMDVLKGEGTLKELLAFGIEK